MIEKHRGSFDWVRSLRFLVPGAILLVVTIIRGIRDPEHFLDAIVTILIPTLVVGLAVIWGAERYWRARSRRTWDLMEQHRPDESKNLVVVYPRTLRDFERLGWRPKQQVPFFHPVVGVVFGTDVTFWTETQTSPTLRIDYSEIDSAELTHTSDGKTTDFQALCLVLVDSRPVAERGRRRRELVLSLHDADNRQVSQMDLGRTFRRMQSNVTRS